MPEDQVEFETTEGMVRSILEKDVRARNDDKYLIYRVLEEIIVSKFGRKLFIPFDLFKELLSYETITRVRRKIQNKEGLYPATEEAVKEKRNVREKFVRNWAVE